MRYFLLSLLLFLAESVLADSGKRLLKITNQDSDPLYGVYILKIPENYLLSSTDEEGRAEIDISTYTPEDRLVIYSMGFDTDTIPVSSLRHSPATFILREKVFELPEATVSQRPFSLLQLIQKVAAKIQKHTPRSTRWEPRRFGQASYTKITYCQDRPVQLCQETGIFVTSGNVRNEKGQWDMAYHLYFMPEYVARSYDFDCSGQDTLKRKYVNLQNPKRFHLNYDVACISKIYNAMRVVYLFTPAFTDARYFSYRLVGEEAGKYTIAFSTLPRYYPHKIRVLSRGTLEIDINTLQLTGMSIEHLDDARYQFKINQTYSQPYQKQLKITFAVDDREECYIRNCQLTTRWLYDYSPTVALREGCPRPNPYKNRLVEQETWQCENYSALPDTPIKSQALEYTLRFIHHYPEGTYRQSFFEQQTPSPEYRKAEEILGRFTDIHRQYLSNSNKPYVENDFIYPSSQWPEIKKFKDRFIQQLKKEIKPIK